MYVHKLVQIQHGYPVCRYVVNNIADMYSPVSSRWTVPFKEIDRNPVRENLDYCEYKTGSTEQKIFSEKKTTVTS
jgi:hypothetical protein